VGPGEWRGALAGASGSASRASRRVPSSSGCRPIAEPAAGPAGQVEEVAHLALQVGRLLLLNGADTDAVDGAVGRFTATFGGEAHLMVGYEALQLTIVAGDEFRTKIGSRVPAMNVGMTAVAAVSRVVDDAEAGRLDLDAVGGALDAIERRKSEYPQWLVIAALGLTAASLSRLFGGDWPTFFATFLAGAAAIWLRLELARRHFNAIAIPFAAACLGGIVGGGAVLLGLSGTPSLCLVAPGMILVPGVPLINGVEDLIKNHVTLGLSRLAFAGLVTVAIALGLFVATVATRVAIPVVEPARAIAIPEDAVFSALAALGYAFLFNVPARLAWACLLCGVASHTTRSFCVDLGLDIAAGTLVGALFTGFLAQGFALWFRAPAAAFAFPGVVAMVPGAYAFRAVIGALEIAHGATAPPVVAATLALGITVGLMVAAIAVGIAAPVLLLSPRHAERAAVFPRGRG
jgi:uncharacterized membrane protein YjjP (DUF1212 family)